MTLELVQSETQKAYLTPDVRGTAATATLRSPAGESVVELEADLDPVDTTVSAIGSTNDVVTVEDGSAFQVGRAYWYGSGSGWQTKVRVAARNGNVLTFEASPLGPPQLGDTIKGLVFDVSIPGNKLTIRGRFYALDWRVTVGTEIATYREEAHITAMRFRDPVTPDDVKRIASESHPSWAKSEPAGRWIRIAEEANARVRELMVAREDYPDLMGDHMAFARAGKIATQLCLADRGRVPNGFEPNTYSTDKLAELEVAVRLAISGRPNDRNADGVVQPTEIRGVRNIRIVRT